MIRHPYGVTSKGIPVHAFTLAAGSLSATILDMGGTITALQVPDRQGGVRNVILGLKDVAAYEASGWWNCLIGRYANRLKGGGLQAFTTAGYTGYAPDRTLGGGNSLAQVAI